VPKEWPVEEDAFGTPENTGGKRARPVKPSAKRKGHFGIIRHSAFKKGEKWNEGSVVNMQQPEKGGDEEAQAQTEKLAEPDDTLRAELWRRGREARTT